MSQDRIKAAIDGAAALADFFGTSPSKVNPIILDLAQHSGYPEHLRGITSLRDLPRYSPELSEDYVTDATGMAAPDLIERVSWMVEHGYSKWRLGENKIVHENETEKFHFHLHF